MLEYEKISPEEYDQAVKVKVRNFEAIRLYVDMLKNLNPGEHAKITLDDATTKGFQTAKNRLLSAAKYPGVKVEIPKKAGEFAFFRIL